MHQHDQPKEDMSVLEQMGYEPSDIAAGKAAKFVAWTAAFVLVTFVASWFIISLVEQVTGAEATVDPKQPINEWRRLPEAPHPLLQSNRTAWKDMIDLKQKEKQALNTYGDAAEEGKARIPIDKAISQTAAQGLPTRPGAGEVNPR